MLLLPISLLFFVPVASSSSKLIFILAGQSNMSGRGGVSNGRWDHKIPPESRPSPSILRLNRHLRWVVAAEPLHADIDVGKPCGVGPGLPFANAIKAAMSPGAAIGLVPCAVGGTRIEEWARGRRLYKEMVARARAAAVGGGGGIGAVLWYQGESDTVERGEAEGYQGRMERLIRDLRVDLGEPQLLVIQVALASGEGPFVDIVRKAQIGINLPNVLCVDAKGLQLETHHHLHLTTQAQVQLGTMLAASYLKHVAYKHNSSMFSNCDITHNHVRDLGESMDIV